MATVLINDTVKRYLLRQPKSFRERVRAKFEYFESGIWEGRLRAKKLKGLSLKCVFEAALEKNLRFLFTLGRPAETSAKDLLIYVWGVATHENLDRKSRLIAPENVPFLGFRDFDEAILEDVVMDDLEPAYLTQERITDKAREDSGQQRWYPVEEPEWKRIRRYSRDDFELFLCLTPEQRSILESPLPILVSGTAGSGKTTLSVYYLLRKHLRGKTKLFVTYNRFLKNFAERLYAGLLNEAEEKSEIRPPDFFVFKDFALALAARFGKTFVPGNEVDFDRFSRMFAGHPLHQKFDPALVWEEIRSIMKGALPQVNTGVLERGLKAVKNREADLSILSKLKHQFLGYADLASLTAVGRLVEKHLRTDIVSFCVQMEKYVQDESRRPGVLAVLDQTLQEIHRQKDAGSKKHLSFLEYEFLGKKKAPNFPFSRKEIYPVVEWYQGKLDGGGLWDELDLTREVLKIVLERDREIPVYDVLVCDEIQDFTDVQIGLLLALTADPRNVFFAGDTKQTINPSGFRWEEVKRLFHERGLDVPRLKSLTLNFRSSGSIVELSNVLLGFKEKYLGVKSDEVREDWKYKGRPVTVVSGVGEERMIEILKTAGARRTILVRTEDEKRRLGALLETELVFTIGEAKGLEFDTVVLWKFCSDRIHRDVWKVIVDLSRKTVHEAAIRHEINLLYVGITRSQKDLIVYDGDRPSVIWEDPQFRERVYTTDDQGFIGEVWNVLTTPEAWIEQGRYFFDREFYGAAMECFKNGGDERLFARAAAHEAEKAGRPLEAALAFEKIGESGRAAMNYQRAGEFRKALPLWEKLGNRDGIFECRIEIFRLEGRPGEAGRLYLGRKRYEDAVRCFREASDHRSMAEVYLRHLKDVRQAAAHFELGQEFKAAAGLYRRLGIIEKAAELFVKGGDLRNAEILWKKTRNTARLLDLYDKAGRYDKMLALHEKRNDFDKAVKCLKMMKDPDRIAREATALFARRKFFAALVRFYVLENQAQTAACYARLGNEEEALRHFKLAGDFGAAGDIYWRRKDFRNALESFLDSDLDGREGYPRARQAIRRIRDSNKLYAIGQELFKKARYDQAAVIYSSFANTLPELGLCRALLREEEKAFQTWDRIVGSKDYDRLADIGLAVGAVGTVAKFFISRSRKLKTGYRWPFGPELKKNRMIAFMDGYFSSRPVPEEMGLWGRLLADIDFEGILWEKTLSLLERGGSVHALLLYLKQHGVLYPQVEQTILNQWKKEIPRLVRAEDWEGLALRYHALGKSREFHDALPRLVLRAGNIGLYLVAEENFFEKGVAWCLPRGLIQEAGEVLSDLGYFERAADVFGRAGEWGKAAENYSLAGKPGRAAPLYEKAGKFGKAGDEYDRAGDYPNALRIYEKHNPFPIKKFARTLEHAGDFRTALTFWKKIGDRKGVERCLRKAGGAAQVELPFLDAEKKRPVKK